MNEPQIPFDLFLHTAPPTIVLQPDAPVFTIVAVSKSYLELTGTTCEDLIGSGLLEAFPENPNTDDNGAIRLKESLITALHTKQQTSLEARRYDIPIRGTTRWEKRYWTSTNSPIVNVHGEVQWIVHTTQDVTTTYNLVQNKRNELDIAEAQRKQLQEAYQQAPVGIGLLSGRELKIEFGNDSILEVLGKTKKIIGKTVAEAIPELNNQPFLQILDKVFISGETYYGNNQLVYFQQNNELKEGYYNFIYHPLKNNDGSSTGIMVIGMNVTKQVMMRKDLEKTIEQKNSIEEALRNNEARLQSILDTMAEGVSITDVDGNVLYANSIAQRMIKVSRDTNGKPLYDDVTWKNLKLDGSPLLWHEHPMNIAVRTKKAVQNFEYGMLLSNNELIYVSLNAAPLFDAEKNLTGAVGTFSDVTSRRLLLDQLAESESRFRGLFEQAPLGMCLLRGREQIIEAANDNILQIWGYAREEVIGLPQRIARPELAGQGVLEWLDEVFVTGKTRRNVDLKIMLRNRDGSPREAVVNSVYHPIKDAAGKVLGVMMITDEITKQYEDRQKAQHAEEMFKRAVGSADLGTWYFDIATLTFVTSDRLKDMLGYANDDEVSYTNVIEQISGEYRENVLNAIRLAYATKESFDIEFPIISRRDKRNCWVKATGKIYTTLQGDAEHFSGTFLDITERKMDEIRKNDFIAMVSHELKTPLTSMKGSLQVLLLQNEINNTSEKEMIIKADQQINKMTNLINSFLNVSRLDSGKIHLEKKTFFMDDLLREELNEMQFFTREHTISFHPCEPIKVFADPDKIAQVINNFISNAVKYSARGTHIEINCSETETDVQVSVKDKGRGIASHDIERLFDRFYRVENKYNTTVAGFGIGLYVCAEIVHRHSGKIWVESELGKGSTFYFTLPLEEK